MSAGAHKTLQIIVTILCLIGWVAGAYAGYFASMELAGYDASANERTPYVAGGGFVGYIVATLLLSIHPKTRSALFPKKEKRSPFSTLLATIQRRDSRTTAPVSTESADVFISYKREERTRVEVIASALRELKLTVWFDAKLPSGKTFDNEINREVRNAKSVLVCWSRAAAESEWVRAEASIGRQRGVLTACFLEPCDLYPPFNLVHAEDLSTTGALDGSNPAWAKIVDQIGHHVGRPGLGAYVLAHHQNDRSAFGAWIAEHAGDPLSDSVLARLRQA